MSGCNSEKGRRSEQAIRASNCRVGLQLLPVNRLAGCFLRDTDVCFPDMASSSRTSGFSFISRPLGPQPTLPSEIRLFKFYLNLHLFASVVFFLDYKCRLIKLPASFCDSKDVFFSSFFPPWNTFSKVLKLSELNWMVQLLPLIFGFLSSLARLANVISHRTTWCDLSTLMQPL